jgi:hypothetical protein
MKNQFLNFEIFCFLMITKIPNKLVRQQNLGKNKKKQLNNVNHRIQRREYIGLKVY